MHSLLVYVSVTVKSQHTAGIHEITMLNTKDTLISTLIRNLSSKSAKKLIAFNA